MLAWTDGTSQHNHTFQVAAKRTDRLEEQEIEESLRQDPSTAPDTL